MRNGLERFAAEALSRAGIQFEEQKTFQLFPAFHTNNTVIERIGKGALLRIKSKSNQDMVFTPDFIGDTWIMETKGLRRPDFDLRWKIFKYQNKEKEWLLLMPKTNIDVIVSTEIIKRWNNGEREWTDSKLLQIYEAVKQSIKKYAKSKTTETKAGKPRAVRKRRFNRF